MTQGREWVWLPLVGSKPEKIEEEGKDGAEDEEGDDDDGPEYGHTTMGRRRRAHKPREWSGTDPQGQPCRKRSLTVERAEEAGVGVDRYFDATGGILDRRQAALCQAVRRAELTAGADAEQAQENKRAEARRKRVRRIEEGKEDRDALRELASSRACDALPLEATPAGVRETAVDGTPRSAKAAGAELRKLTQSFYERLLDPRFYNIAHEELQAVRVRAKMYSHAVPLAQNWGWQDGVRSLKRYGGKRVE